MQVNAASPEYITEYLVGLLVHAASNSPGDQKRIMQSLGEFTAALPESPRYFAMVLLLDDAGVAGIIRKGNSQIPDLMAMQVRAMAGLLLKNQLPTLQEPQLCDTVRFLREAKALGALSDPSPLIRSTVGTVLSAIVTRSSGNLDVLWPELLSDLLRLGTLPAMDALERICQDGAEAGGLNEQQASLLIPALIQLAKGHPDPRGRCHALVSLNQFIMYGADAFDQHISDHLQCLSLLASQDAAQESVRQAICQSLSLLLDAYPDEMTGILPGVLGFALESLGREDLSMGVRLEACEFWHSLAERDQAVEIWSPSVLQQLLPVLLRAIRYSDDDPALLENDDGYEDASRPDAASSIRPRHHRAASHVGNEEDEEEDEEDEDEEDEWNLRKCAASTLDLLATTTLSKGAIVGQILPLISQQLQKSDWKTVESSILALGAVSEGIGEAEDIEPHLSTSIVPFLIESYRHQKPLVRSIAAWTLGRYAQWMSVNGMEVLAALLHGMRDGHKRVQRASCSALASFLEAVEDAKGLFEPAAVTLVASLGWALQNYQLKNRLALYDTIGTLADQLDSDVRGLGATTTSSPSLVPSLLPALLADWEAHAGMSSKDSLEYCYTVFPLLECLASLAIAGGPEFGPWAGKVYAMAIGMCGPLMIAREGGIAREEEDEDTIEADSLIVALDLIGGLLQGGLGPSFHDAHALGQIILKCSYDPIPEIRQSAFALIGDCAQRHVEPILPVIGQLIPILQGNFDPNQPDGQIYYSLAASNNAVWAFGELLYRHGSVMEGIFKGHANTLHGILSKLLLLGSKVERSPGSGYAGNLAVAIGRSLGFASSNHLDIIDGALQGGILRMLPNWIAHLHSVGDQEERITGLLPVLNLLNNPAALSQIAEKTLVQLILAIHGCSPSEADKAMAGWISHGVLAYLGADQVTRLLENALPQPSDRSSFMVRFQISK